MQLQCRSPVQCYFRHFNRCCFLLTYMCLIRRCVMRVNCWWWIVTNYWTHVPPPPSAAAAAATLDHGCQLRARLLTICCTCHFNFYHRRSRLYQVHISVWHFITVRAVATVRRTVLLSSEFFFSVTTITHEALHSAWWYFARTCTSTTSRTPLNFKVIGQTLRSFLWVDQSLPNCFHRTWKQS